MHPVSESKSQKEAQSSKTQMKCSKCSSGLIDASESIFKPVIEDVPKACPHNQGANVVVVGKMTEHTVQAIGKYESYGETCAYYEQTASSSSNGGDGLAATASRTASAPMPPRPRAALY